MSRSREPRQQDDAARLGAVWPWLVLPVLPLVAGFTLLKILYGPDFSFIGFPASFVDAPHGPFLYLEGLLAYGSAALLHLSLCAAAIGYFATRIRDLPRPVRARAWRVVGLLLVALVIIGAVTRLDPELTALQLSYRNTCELLSMAGAAVHLLPATCQGGPPSVLMALASVPTIAGLIAAAFAAALASSAADPLPETEGAWRAGFTRHIRTLQHAFYALSAVLITSTVTIMLFLMLPVAIAADPATTAALTSYAHAMTVFWGTVFTLTLAAIFAPAVHHLSRAARRHEMASKTPADVRVWLAEQTRNSLPRHLGNLAALLAPLLVGPIGSLLEKLSGVAG